MTPEDARARATTALARYTAIQSVEVYEQVKSDVAEAILGAVHDEVVRLAKPVEAAVDAAMEQVEKLGRVHNGPNFIMPEVRIFYGRLRTIILGALIGKAAQVEVDEKFATKYPEHAKLKLIQPLTQAVGDFIEWLGEQKLAICQMTQMTDSGSWSQYLPVMKTRDMLLAEHFEIDNKRLDREKDAMLDAHRQETGMT